MFRRHGTLEEPVDEDVHLPLPEGPVVLAGKGIPHVVDDWGPDGGHDPGTHEYAAAARILAACLKHSPDVQATVVNAGGEWPEGPAAQV